MNELSKKLKSKSKLKLGYFCNFIHFKKVEIITLQFLMFFIFFVVMNTICLSLPDLDTDDMVSVSKGEFIIGANTGFNNEKPERRINLETFYIDKYEVSNKKYKEFIDSKGYSAPKDWSGGTYPDGKENFPVVNISYDDAIAYCSWAGKRLPTEEEWEKAARGTDGRKYPWGNEWDKNKCNTFSYMGNNSLKRADSFPEGKSKYGCYNMSGNVWEWTYTWYKLLRDQDSKLNLKYKVIRGGSWLKLGNLARCSVREALPPNEGYGDVGFRCVK